MKRVILNYARPGTSNASSMTLREMFLGLMLVAIVSLEALAFALPRMNRPTVHSNRTRPMNDIYGITTALKIFQVQNHRYPTTLEGLQALFSNPGNLEHWEKTLDVSAVPVDPWGRPYIYRRPGKNGNPFDLLSAGPDGIAGTPDDIFE